jgi:hypothetical protein
MRGAHGIQAEIRHGRDHQAVGGAFLKGSGPSAAPVPELHLLPFPPSNLIQFRGQGDEPQFKPHRFGAIIANSMSDQASIN